MVLKQLVVFADSDVSLRLETVADQAAIFSNTVSPAPLRIRRSTVGVDPSVLCSTPITGASSLLWALLTSHSSLLLRLMRPPVRPPRLRRALFPLIYLPHLLVLPATFGLHRFWPTYPYFPALYVVPVRQAKGLPTASFRFHLTMNTLAVRLCTSSLPTRTRDFHPLERAHGAQTQKKDCSHLREQSFSTF